MVGKIGNDGMTQALRPLNILKLIENNLLNQSVYAKLAYNLYN